MLLQRLGVQLQSQLPSTSTSEDFYQPSSDKLEAKQIVTVRRFLSSLLWITQQLMSSQVWTSRDTHRFRYGLWYLVTQSEALLVCQFWNAFACC